MQKRTSLFAIALGALIFAPVTALAFSFVCTLPPQVQLDARFGWGKYNPAACNPNSKVPIDGHAVDASTYAPDPDAVDLGETSSNEE